MKVTGFKNSRVSGKFRRVSRNSEKKWPAWKNKGTRSYY